jgi:hypothetical protein
MVKKAGITIFLLIIAAFSGILPAQTPADIFSRLESKKTGEGLVKIIQDAEIRNFVNLHLSHLKKINGIRGYRISIYFGSGQEAKKNADLSRARFISKYEDVKCYKQFEYPYFKVYVGDFRTKSEALRFQKIIENDYPDAFIREDIISFPD